MYGNWRFGAAGAHDGALGEGGGKRELLGWILYTSVRVIGVCARQ